VDQLITKFYSAFQNKDWQTMQSCYHDEATFSDPVFQNLNAKEVKAMWHMLVTSGKDLVLQFSNVQASATNGSCHWEAFYTFSKTGKKVHNIIEARFEFKDGKIFRHTDSFDLWRWGRMALGLSGLLLGWSSVLQNKVRSMAKANLTKFMSSNGY
jgi:hypothetical protein